MMEKKRIIDLVVILFFLLLSLSLFLLLGGKYEGSIVRIRLDVTDEGTYSLSQDGL